MSVVVVDRCCEEGSCGGAAPLESLGGQRIIEDNKSFYFFGTNKKVREDLFKLRTMW